MVLEKTLESPLDYKEIQLLQEEGPPSRAQNWALATWPRLPVYFDLTHLILAVPATCPSWLHPHNHAGSASPLSLGSTHWSVWPRLPQMVKNLPVRQETWV